MSLIKVMQFGLLLFTGVYEQGDGPAAEEIEDEGLTPLQRITKYAWAEEVYNRSVNVFISKCLGVWRQHVSHTRASSDSACRKLVVHARRRAATVRK